MSTVKVNELSTYSGTDISIETGKTVSGTASQIKMTDVVQGDVLYGSAADTLSRLAPGTSGQVLQTQGAAANTVWAATAAGGKVLQVISSISTGYQKSTTSTSFVDVESSSSVVWETAITPSATSSKILIIATLPINVTGAGNSDNRAYSNVSGKVGAGAYAVLVNYQRSGSYAYVATHATSTSSVVPINVSAPAEVLI